MLADTEKQFREADPEQNNTGGVLDALKRNEDGDADLFVSLNRGRFTYDYAAARWFVFRDHHWTEDRLDEVTASMIEVVDLYGAEAQKQSWLKLKAEKSNNSTGAKRHAAVESQLLKRIRDLHTIHRKRNVLAMARAGEGSLGVTGDDWDGDHHLLGVSNGVIDLRTGERRDGQPDDMIRCYAPTEWQGLDAPAPTWDKTLRQIFQDQKVVNYLQRFLGYALTGQCIEHKLAVAWGKGRNGKGTITETIHHVLGPHLSGPIEAEMLLAQRFTKQAGSPASDILSLRGKRIVWASETGQGRSLNAGKVKWLTGGDSLTGRPLYTRDPVVFRPTHTLILLTNHRPTAPADDYALWQRLHLIPFTQSFVENPIKDNEHPVDLGLPEKLKAESSGILAWMVRGALTYQETGLSPPEAVLAATKEYQIDEDIIGHFLQECCILQQGAEAAGGDLYKAYRNWCETSGHRPVSGVRFGKDMKERFEYIQKRTTRYVGVGLQEE